VLQRKIRLARGCGGARKAMFSQEEPNGERSVSCKENGSRECSCEDRRLVSHQGKFSRECEGPDTGKNSLVMTSDSLPSHGPRTFTYVPEHAFTADASSRDEELGAVIWKSSHTAKAFANVIDESTSTGGHLAPLSVPKHSTTFRDASIDHVNINRAIGASVWRSSRIAKAIAASAKNITLAAASSVCER